MHARWLTLLLAAATAMTPIAAQAQQEGFGERAAREARGSNPSPRSERQGWQQRGDAGQRAERQGWQQRGDAGQRAERQSWRERGDGQRPDRQTWQQRNTPTPTTTPTTETPRPDGQRWSGQRWNGQRGERGTANRDWRSPNTTRPDARPDNRPDNGQYRGWRDNNRQGVLDNTRRQWGNENARRDNDRRWDNNRRWDNDRRWDNNRRYDRNDRRGYDNRSWDRQWRNDRRYDWQSYRSSNRNIYRMGRYYSPYNNWSYRRLTIGFSLMPLFYSDRYWINDPWTYRLPSAYGNYRWVRYYDDALLVDVYSGEVVDVMYDFFW